MLMRLFSAAALSGASLVLAAGPQDPTSPTAPPRGLGWADVDLDGLPDLLARGADGGVKLLRNLGSAGFGDVTEEYGLGALRDVRSASWMDVDGDGLPDLVTLDGDGRPHLQRHLGAFFRDVTLEAGLSLPSGALEQHWLDADDDGLPDLLLVGADRQLLLRNLGSASFRMEELPAALSTRDGAGAAVALAGSEEQAPAPAATETTGTPEPRAAALTRRGAEDTRTAKAGSASGGSSRTAAARGTPGNLPGVACTPSLTDLAGGACIEASSTPQLGTLHPLSIDLNLTAGGDVGMGTTQPRAPAHLVNNDMNLQSTALFGETLIVEDRDSVLGLYSDGSGGWGSALALGQVGQDGGLDDKWTIARRTSGVAGGTSSDGSLELTYGSDSDFSLNKTAMVLEADGDVSIGLGAAGGDRLSVYTSDTDGTVMRVQQGDPSSDYDAMIVYHNGTGAAINASTNIGEHAIRASGKKGVYATGSQNGVHAYSGSGTAVYAQNGASSPGPAVLATSSGGLPTLYVTNHDPSDPKAASFGGDVDIGYPGFSGLTVIRATVGTDSTNAGFVQLRDDTGATTILLDADSSGKGRIVTDVLEITGGADLVESFDTREDSPEPGTVLVIDSERAGELAIARSAYDRRVAGVVSGAGDVQPGLSMGQEGVASGDTLVALTGRVYVKTSAENGPVRPGDRLTTANTAGHAMRVSDASRADGAVLGKAMGALDEGTGLVLVLVNLQ